ncbi:MAG: HlyD family secretion protein [Gammaproteobacteria bacterium]|nr:HlyD family secretion protein [Gammaproteobacteria bacterium]
MQSMGAHLAETLYRKQAIEALSRRPFGRPIAVVPRPWSWLVAFLLSAVLVAGFYLCTADYARKESVRGWLVVRDGVALIRADSAGVVDRIYVSAGGSVQAGETLIAMRTERYLADGRSRRDAITSRLREQFAALESQVDLLRAEERVERDSIKTQLDRLDEQRRALNQENVEQQRRLQTAHEKMSLLARSALSGASSDWSVLDQQDEYAQLRQRSAQLRQSMTRLQRDQEALRARAKTLPLETERSIAGLVSEMAQLQRRITDQEINQSVAFKSPIQGRLASLEVREGDTVLPNQRMATVMPVDAHLLAEVFVPSSAIAFVRPGQAVRLMFDAFPQRQFGTFAGEVASVSDAVLMPADLPQTFFPREATFSVRIRIRAQTVQLETGSVPLRPGMLLAAEIILESRRLLDRALDPLRLRRRAPT